MTDHRDFSSVFFARLFCVDIMVIFVYRRRVYMDFLVHVIPCLNGTSDNNVLFYLSNAVRNTRMSSLPRDRPHHDHTALISLPIW